MKEVGTVSFDGLGGDYQYGPIEERSPGVRARSSRYDAKAPFGLKALETNLSSAAAEAFEFEAEP